MTLKIAVLVKQVPDHEAVVHIAGDEQLDIENRYVCSFFDEIALEQAIALEKDIPGTSLLALSVGGKRAVEALRRAVAMGVDTVERLGDDVAAEGDALYIAAILAARLRQFEPDVVLCGKQAGDDELGAIGPMVAELLGVPHVSAATALQLDKENRAVGVQRKLDGVTYSTRCTLPVLISVEKGLIEPHVPVVTRVMKAMKAKIPQISVEDLDLDSVSSGGRVRRLKYSYPPVRPAVQMVDSAEALAKILLDKGLLS